MTYRLMVIYFSIPSVPSSRATDSIVFQVHDTIDRLVARKPSWSFKVWSVVFCPEYRPPFVAVLIIAIEGGILGRIFSFRLRGVLRGLRGRTGRLRVIQRFIRDLHVI